MTSTCTVSEKMCDRIEVFSLCERSAFWSWHLSFSLQIRFLSDFSWDATCEYTYISRHYNRCVFSLFYSIYEFLKTLDRLETESRCDATAFRIQVTDMRCEPELTYRHKWNHLPFWCNCLSARHTLPGQLKGFRNPPKNGLVMGTYQYLRCPACMSRRLCSLACDTNSLWKC